MPFLPGIDVVHTAAVGPMISLAVAMCRHAKMLKPTRCKACCRHFLVVAASRAAKPAANLNARNARRPCEHVMLLNLHEYVALLNLRVTMLAAATSDAVHGALTSACAARGVVGRCGEGVVATNSS